MQSHSEEKPDPCNPSSESEIDEALADSFPASDPPPWTLGVETCPPEEEKDKEEGK